MRSWDGVALTKGVVARICRIRNTIMSNSVRRTRDTYRVCGRTHVRMYRERAILYRSACPPLGYAECVSLMPVSLSPSGGETTDIYYCAGLLSSFFFFFFLFFSSSSDSISSSSVRRRNNLIPYSRGGCRPWRIEWNKIKPRIPRVLWRGSFPTHFGRVCACLHNRELLSSHLIPDVPLSRLFALWFFVIVLLSMIA